MNEAAATALEEGWRQIQDVGVKPFMRLVESQPGAFFKAHQYMKVYNLIYRMCNPEHESGMGGPTFAEPLYERYTASIVEYLQRKAKPALEQAADRYDTALFTAWKTQWSMQKVVVKGLTKMWMHLEQIYPELHLQGYKLFKEQVFDPFIPKVCAALLRAMADERKGEEQNRALLRESVDVVLEVGYFIGEKKTAAAASPTQVSPDGKTPAAGAAAGATAVTMEENLMPLYQKEIEAPILAEAEAYYRRQAPEWLLADSCPNYLVRVEKLLADEQERVRRYLHPRTASPMQRRCYEQLLKQTQSQLLSKKTGLAHLLQQQRLDDLSRVYRLYAVDRDDLQILAALLQDFLRREGIALVDRLQPATKALGVEEKKGDEKSGAEEKKGRDEPPHDLVQQLITFHAQYTHIVQHCFANDALFQKALRTSFSEFVNRNSVVSKLLAIYIDDLLRAGSKLKVDGAGFEQTLNNIVFLYGYLQEKDVFEYDYQFALSKRLLLGLSESEHSEKSLIAKLKTESGYQWTNKLEGMFKDVQASRDMMAKFRREIYDPETREDLQLHVTVCSTGFWPAAQMPHAALPEELKTVCEKFQRFYINSHSGHKLAWRMDQGLADVAVQFAPKMRRTLVVSSFQMLILTVFNHLKVASFEQIHERTKIPKAELELHIMSMAHPRVGVLAKKPMTATLEDSHLFRLNPAFKSTLLKVSVPVIARPNHAVNAAKANAAIESLRRHQMDAAIVRIMKSRKSLLHAVLVGEVIQQLQARFKPQPSAIRKRIDAMIDQDYMLRDPKSRNTYNYNA